MLLNTFLWSINNISSSLNISLTSFIAFIKCLHRHQSKNNIRYGNINNTSVIIFLNRKVKKPQQWYFAWENLRGGFCCFCSSFHFHFIFVSLFCCCCSSFCCCCSSFHFQAAFPCQRHSTLASQAREGLHQL